MNRRANARLAAWAVAISLCLPAGAAVVADSIADYSTTTQGAGGWHYGFFNRTQLGSYSAAGFVEFAGFSIANNRWEASDAQVGADNNDFLSLNTVGGHPNGIGPSLQDAEIWAVRRYVSEMSGPVRLDFDVHKVNVDNPRGGGITGRVFVDGLEVFAGYVANDDAVGLVRSLTLNLALGSVVDFAIDPTGIANGGDGAASARADGSYFAARFDDQVIPEPPAALLAALGLLALVASRRQRAGH